MNESSHLHGMFGLIVCVCYQNGRSLDWLVEGCMMEALSEREKQVAVLVARGLSNPEIAEALGIVPATVRNHITNIMEKLGLHSTRQLTAYVWEQGWLKPGRTSDMPE